jgi:EAL domain-containing protein (putative c-di-GMP-specific phosphodiesterase class I)
MTAVAVTDFKAERDRFVAFAFAAADLLFEIDTQGRIQFAAGATQRLAGRGAEQLIGTSFYDLLSADDGGIAAVHVASLRKGGRFVPLVVHFKGGMAALLGACALPDRQDTIYLTLSLAPVTAGTTRGEEASQPMMPGADFARLATQKVSGDGKDKAQLTLVSMEGLAELRQRVSKDVADGLQAAIGRQVKLTAGGGAASVLADGRYGVLHNEPIDVGQLTLSVTSLSKAVDPTGAGIKMISRTIALAKGDLSDADAARTLVYAINAFAQSKEQDFTITSLKDGLDKLLSNTAARVKDLRQRIDDKAFFLAFQPIVELGVRAVHHCEALVRFPEGGSPFTVVTFAEEVGLAADFDLAIADRVLKTLAAKGNEKLVIAINVSGRSLESTIFVDALLKLTDEFRSVLPRFLVEVTESAGIARLKEANQAIQVLRQRAIRACLDDFGSGANSFQYLHNFNVDFVKIDGELVERAMTSSTDLMLLRAIVKLCKKQKAQAIAERIETEEQAAALRKIGVDFGQGYLFAKPGPEAIPAAFVPSTEKRRRS